ncbi:hypothetical protein [Caenispirillum salinarum]|uniref:hypothetical protein n=1 Tax=Caenispirillum salinarum TaxID=859058 RepID=UPI00384ED282
MTPIKISATALGLLLMAAPAALAEEGMDKQAKIDNALSAATPMIAENASVMTPDGTVLREGSGAYTCFPEGGGVPAPMCLDEPWMGWLDAYVNDTDFQADEMGIAYMLAGDGAGASNVDPRAEQPAAGNDWVVEGPHLMMLVPDTAMLEALPTDYTTGEPYVMWKGTPYVHVMVPTGDRPQQPQVAER